MDSSYGAGAYWQRKRQIKSESWTHPMAAKQIAEQAVRSAIARRKRIRHYCPTPIQLQVANEAARSAIARRKYPRSYLFRFYNVPISYQLTLLV
jgi:hypothetical protein